jgi:hypothetical protein
MVARLINAPIEEGEQAIGAGTVGSSEAIMLAGLAFKRKWQNERKAAGKPWDKPNMVTGANVQVRRLRIPHTITGAFVQFFFNSQMICLCVHKEDFKRGATFSTHNNRSNV